ncbi:MAG: ABC transporter ATP-binding protein [Gemmatimonadetes bacterium]|nr:ABC transporter ATP-binding protein [Gemmatimonadota bacterium]
MIASDRAAGPPVVRVDDLSVEFPTTDGIVHAVDGLTFSVGRGQTLGIVGESGSGKTVASLAIMGLHDRARARVRGRILVGGDDVVPMSEEQVRLLRGRRMAMIFQDPLTALHPYYTIGRQIAEAYQVHNEVAPAAARARAVELMGRVGIPQPAKRADSYPHELSGGMRQRAMIAMALSCNPELLIADEPTTALDVTVQAQILDLMADLQSEFHSAIILITHDLGVVARLADHVLVMYAGREAECGTAEQVLRHPQHPYTWGLLRSVPSLHGDVSADLVPIVGNPPSLIDVPPGCPFHPRCPYAGQNGDRSFTEVPPLVSVAGERGHQVACHLPEAERRAIFEREVAGVGVARS